MGRDALMLAFVVGAALLALWADARPLRRLNFGWRGVAAQVGAALLVLAAAPTAMGWLVDPNDSRGLVLAALLALFLPALVYAFLSALWLFKQLQRTVGMR